MNIKITYKIEFLTKESRQFLLHFA